MDSTEGKTTDDRAIVAEATASAVVAAIKAQRREDLARIGGYKAIAELVAELSGHEPPHETTIRKWVVKHRFPMDKDLQGVSVRRVDVERWLDKTRRAVKD